MDLEAWRQRMAAADEMAAGGHFREAAETIASLPASSDERVEAVRTIKLGWYRAHYEADGDGPRESEEELAAVIEHPPTPDFEIAARPELLARRRLEELEANRDPA